MKTSWIRSETLRTVVACCAWFLIGCEREAPRPVPSADGMRRVGVLFSETSGEFGRLMEAGAREAAKELGFEVRTFQPKQTGNESEMLTLMQRNEGALMEAWVVLASGQKSPGSAIERVRKRGVPVVLVDFLGKGEAPRDFLASVGTNEGLAGRRGAEETVKLMGGAGRVFFSRGVPGASPAKEREAGFLELMRRQLNIQVLGEKAPGADSVEAVEGKSIEQKGDLSEATAVFCATSVATEGMLRALRKLKWAGHKRLVGFEANPELLEALRKREIHALLVPNPRRMGQEAVRLLAAHWRGNAVAASLEVPVELLSPQNVDSVTAKKWLRAAE